MSIVIDPSKKRLLVILGAGSTICAGSPSTAKITRRVCGISDEPIRSVVAGLCTQRGKDGFNFETVLACLEELDEFNLRQKSPPAWDRLGGVLSAFADLKLDFEAQTKGRSFLTARWGLINSLSKFVLEKTRKAPIDHLKQFFDRLREHFDLTVVTLNYDDIVDRTGDWYDGFESPSDGATKQFESFDSAGFRHKSMHYANVLLHLHGSIRFGYDPASASRDIVRYANADQAFESVKKKGTGMPWLTAPLISGQHKDRYMTRACVPFGYYHNAFVNAVCECSRVLIAGYSGRDLHIAAWIREEGSRLYGDHHRVVCIDPAWPCPSTPTMFVLKGSDGAFPPAESKHVQQIVDHLNQV